MRLQLLHDVQAPLLLKLNSKQVVAFTVHVVLLTHFKHILSPCQSYDNSLGVQLVEGRYQTFKQLLLDQHSKLLRLRVLRRVGQHPNSFLANFRNVIDQSVHNVAQNPTVQYHLDLLGRACSDVRERPTHFPPDLLVRTAHQSAESLQSTSVNHKLCQAVIPGQHIAECSEARHLDVQVIELAQ